MTVTEAGDLRTQLCRAVPVYVTFWVYATGWAATATRPPTMCGNCRRDLAAQQALMWGEVPWLFGLSVLAWVLAPRTAHRVARSATAVSLAVWLVAVGLVRGWW